MSISRSVRRKSALFAAVSFAAVAAIGGRSHAADVTWNGGGADNNLSTGANWIGGIAPVANDGLIFDGNVRLTPTNDFPAGPPAQSFSGVTFASGAGAFNFGGANAFILTGNINQNAATNQAISAPILLENSNTTVAVGGAGTLSLGAITMGATNGSANVSTLNINNTVSATTFLARTDTASSNTMTIASGATFNLTGTFNAGFAPSGAANTLTNLNITGGGTFNLTTTTNANFNIGVGAGSNTPTGQPRATIDMSGLANFIYSTGAAGTGQFGVGNLVTRPSSILRLANTSNSITAASVVLGDSNQAGGNNGGGTNTLSLGAGTNVINTNNITVGNTKGAGLINWVTTTGTLVLKGQTGGASTVNITVGRANNTTGTGTNNQVQLAGHDVTVQAGTVVLGNLAGATGGTCQGTLTFDTGTFNVSSMQLGVNASGTAPNGATGNLTIGGAAPNATATGVMNVTSQFFLGNAATTSATPTKANFTVNGGTANINADILVNGASTTTTYTTTLTLAGGTLNMMGHAIGTAARPITTVTLPTAGQTATLSNLAGTGINGAGLNHSGGGTLILGGANSYSGSTTIGAGSTLKVAGTLTGGGSIANDGVLELLNSTPQTLAGQITNGGSLLQSGAGTTTLSAANSYTGATDVSAGGINVTGSLANGGAVNINATASSAGTLSGNGSVGNIVVAANDGSNIASIRPGATATDGQIATLTAQSLTVNGGNLRVDASAGADLLSVIGAAAFNAPSTVTVAPGAATGTYTILSAGTLTGTAPTLTNAGVGRSTFGLNFDTTNNIIQLQVAGSPLSLSWTGAVNGTWDMSTSGGPTGTANWNNGSGSDTFFEQDNVTFGNGPTNRTITVSGTVSPGSVTFANNSSNTYTISGSGGIGGIGGLTVSGGGSVVLGTANTYSGATNVTNGTLAISSSGSIASPSITVGAAGTLTIANPAGVSSSVALTNNGSVLLSGAHTIGALNGSGTINTSGDLSVSGGGAYAGVISGAGALNNTAGTLIVTSANTYTGGTTVSGGTLQLGDGASGGSVVGPVTVTGAGTLGLNLPASATFSNNISGTGGIAQTAANTLTLTGTLNYGPTAIAAGGTVSYAGTSSKTVGAINGAGNVVVGDGATASLLSVTGSGNYTGTTTINSGSTLSATTLANGGANSSIGSANNGATDLLINGGALKWVAAVNQTSNRNFTMSNLGATIDASPSVGAAALTLNGTGTIGFSDTGARTLTFAGTELTPLLIGTNAFNLIISDQEGSVNRTTVVKNGNNRWQFGGANTYTGGTIINTGGIRAANIRAFGTGLVTVANGAQAYLNVGGQFDNNFSIQGIGPAEAPGTEAIGNYGALRIANNGAALFGTITLTGDTRITGRGANTGGTIAGQITGNFNLEFGNTGGGTGNVIISNSANDWSGNTIISHGTLKTGGGDAIPRGAGKGNVIVNNTSTTIDSAFDLNGFNQQINGLVSQGADPTRVKVTSAGGFGQLTLGNNNATAIYNGTLLDTTGQFALVKVGSGVQTIGGGANTYTGGTTVSGGTLRFTGAATVGGSGSAVVNDATLQIHSSSNTLGTVTGAGSVAIGNGTSAATVIATHVRQANASVADNAVLKIAQNAQASGVSKIDHVTIAANAKFDLTDNKLITLTLPGTASGGTYSGLQGEVQRAYDFNAWDLPGLTTSMPDAIAGLTTIGIATGEQMRGLGPTDTDTFGGQTITGASTIAMYTYAGDGNLDGVIDGGDYGIIDNFVQVPGADGYANGDFNYDGVIDGGDYGVIDNNIQAQGPGFPTSGSASATLSGVTAVPEPSACGFAMVTAAAIAGRRRRRRHR